MSKVDPDWWKKLFDETYLITDARSVCDDDLTIREVDFLENFLDPDKTCAILDLCGGQGRHSLELSRRGFQDITVLDFSEFLISRGKKKAQEEGLSINFIQNDARKTGLPDQRFRVILVMASSFGYFLKDSENAKILQESHRLLNQGGTLLLDLPNREFVLNNFTPCAWHEADDDILVCRSRRVDDAHLLTRELVLSKARGLIRDEHYSTRLYRPGEITGMLKSTGFSSIEIKKDFVTHTKSSDYGCMTNRMVVLARK